MDIIKYNSIAWDKLVDDQSEWTVPVSEEIIKDAKMGISSIVLTNEKSVPQEWYMPIMGKRVLCLACGGGQQAPVIAALGGDVTVFDNSKKQLERDLFVAQRDKLDIDIVQGDMKDLSIFKDESFDLIFHPISNCFIDDPQPVWKECYRVLKKGGELLSGFINPVYYIFDLKTMEQENKLKVTGSIPYSDIEQICAEYLKKRIEKNETLEYGHTLESQIAGQLNAGFMITGFYEDVISDKLVDKHIKTTIATKAIKL
jgi:ubiquinone/menaquinone biosynthesis C-methylase UbiE